MSNPCSWRFLLVILVTAITGCRPRDATPDARDRGTLATQPATKQFTSPGIRLSYPAEWTPAPSGEYVLRLVPRGTDDDANVSSLSLDVPKLPPHLPGFIPLGLVVNGYVDDLKEKHPGVQVDEPVDATVAGAKARRVRATWDDAAGQSLSETAVLTVHGDRVYIFRGNADAGTDDRAGTALDAVLATVRWD